jgi:curli biogenesis system outer membrane secretion channel CsgG
MGSILKFLILSVCGLFFFSCTALEQVTQPTAKATPSRGPTIEQAQKEEYLGPKARVAVTKFFDKSAKGRVTGEIGDGMAEMLANVLFATNRFIVLERRSLDDIIREQDFGASGRVSTETAARIGEIEGADLLIEGTITEFEPGVTGAGGGGVGSKPGVVVIDIFGGIKTSHVAVIVKVIDARTGRRVASEQVEGKATDFSGIIGGGGGGLAGVFGGFSKTPMEKAIRIAIDESVKMIVAKTPAEFYRVSPTPQPQVTHTPTAIPQQVPPSPATPATPPPQIITVPKAPAQPPLAPSVPKLRIVYVKWPKVSLREGPGTNFKTLMEVKKGTCLAVIEEKDQWLRVSLEDGREGWIGKATTSETP